MCRTFPFLPWCTLEPLSLRLEGAMWFVLLIAVIFFGLLFLAYRHIHHPILSRGLSLAVVLVLAGALAVLLIAGVVSPVALPRRIEELGIISLFFALLLVVLVFLLLTRGGRWIFAILVAVALLAAACDLNDNHAFRRIAHGAGVSRGLDIDFSNWLAARRDRDRFTQRRYPVYIVAAEGGGIYAAYHAAMVLARMQDQCPNFSQHVFAISSVSGGSLGAAIFGGLSEQTAKNSTLQGCQKYQWQGPLEELTDQLLAQDHLSPALWGLLFPDFFQRFLPFPWSGLDRARWLERSFEYSWSEIVRSRYFEQPLLRRFQPDGATPALLMNTTEVATGHRIVLTGFPLDGAVTGDGVQTINPLIEPRAVWDLPVSTAVGLSARFPVISPVGSVPGRTTIKLVDGGYFENSGVETALDVMRVLKPIATAAAERIALRLIVIESAAADPPSQAFSEIMSPVRTMFNTRVTRGTLARLRAWRELCDSCEPVTVLGDAVWPRIERGRAPAAGPLIWHSLDGINYPLPLGWHLGPVSQSAIRAQVGGTADCMVPTTPSQVRPPLFDGFNNCLFSQIADEIENGVE
jgi:Patatin-like phospholipase